jgi:hypothetical protein
MKAIWQYAIAALILLGTLCHAQTARLEVLESHLSSKNSQLVVVTVRTSTAMIKMVCDIEHGSAHSACRMPLAGETASYELTAIGVYVGTNVEVTWTDGTWSAYSVIASHIR